jgi:predicted nucleic acid-binding protein
LISDSSVQFWDTSAFLSLFYTEPHTTAAYSAKEFAEHYMAWDWIQVESHAALARRGFHASQEKNLETLLRYFTYVSIAAEDYLSVAHLAKKHKLRAADAGHLYCLKKAAHLFPKITFVCFDKELVNAAKSEKIPVWKE